MMLGPSQQPNFDSAAREVLKLLQQRLGFGLWMVTRTDGDDWIVLQAEDHGYGVNAGSVFSWADSFCSQMVLGRGPRIAPHSVLIPCYASAPIGRTMKIGAYIGVPLFREGGSLFGTLCAVDPDPQPAAVVDELPLIEMLARLLSSILEANLKAAEQARLVERVQAEALTDSLTGLYNRRGWDQLLAIEENRCRRYGHSACVLLVDLDGLKQINDTYGHACGDELIRRAGQAIRTAVREPDIVARIGGDEFVVLGIECDKDGSEMLQERVRDALVSAQVEGSVGLAVLDPRFGLAQALEQADQIMYTHKNLRRNSYQGHNNPNSPSHCEDKLCLT